jgi:hypothetical protein
MFVRCDMMGDQPDDYTQQMRWHRDGFLASCDWTQSPDSPLSDSDKQAWATYRQALRDAPATWTVGPTWEAPNPPA